LITNKVTLREGGGSAWSAITTLAALPVPSITRSLPPLHAHENEYEGLQAAQIQAYYPLPF
jgi:hypothetical protein